LKAFGEKALRKKKNPYPFIFSHEEREKHRKRYCRTIHL